MFCCHRNKIFSRSAFVRSRIHFNLLLDVFSQCLLAEAWKESKPLSALLQIKKHLTSILFHSQSGALAQKLNDKEKYAVIQN